MAYDRLAQAHQPAIEKIDRTGPSTADVRAACAGIAAVITIPNDGCAPLSVFADDPAADPYICSADSPNTARPLQIYKGKTLIAHTLDLLADCGITHIHILCTAALKPALQAALQKSTAAQNDTSGEGEGPCRRAAKPAQNKSFAGSQSTVCMQSTMPTFTFHIIDPVLDARIRAEMCDFSVFNICGQALDLCLRATGVDGIEAAMVLPADMVRLKSRHIYKLARAMAENPQADVVASWITWYSRPPYILCPHLLQNLETSRLCAPAQGCLYRPAPKLDVVNVLFGEERLEAAPPAKNVAAEDMAQLTISAAVAAAAAQEALKEAAKSGEGGAYAGPQTPNPGDEYFLPKAKIIRPRHTEKSANTKSIAQANATAPTPAPTFPAQLRSRARKILQARAKSKIDALVLDVALDVAIDANRAYASIFGDDARAQIETFDAWAQKNRLDFPIFGTAMARDLTYLDSAATSQHVGRATLAAAHFESYECANIYRGAYRLSAAATARTNDARAVLEAHINADRRQTIYTKNTSDSAQIVATAWGDLNIGPGDIIICATAEHHSNLLPWTMLAARRGACVKFVDYTPDGRLDIAQLKALLTAPTQSGKDESVEGEGEGAGEDGEYREGMESNPSAAATASATPALGTDAPAIKPGDEYFSRQAKTKRPGNEGEGRVKLVAISHVNNVFGMENPIHEIADAAHAVGARVYVDGAQAFPHLPVDVKALGCDFYAASAHKAYGPFGVGFLWVAPDAFDEMDPQCAGGGTVSYVGFDEYYLRMGAIQYELGTPNISGQIGFAAAIEYMDALGMDKIEAHAAAMTDYLMCLLSTLEGITVWADHAAPKGRGGLVSYTIGGVVSSEAAEVMGKLGVCVRAGGHCALPLANALGVTGSIRISTGVYTTKQDLLAATIATKVAQRLLTNSNLPNTPDSE